MADNRFADLADNFDNVLHDAGASNIAAAMVSLPPDGFDYSATPLTFDEVEMVKVRRRRIIRILSTAVIEAGENLLEIKRLIFSRCPRGAWTQWLRTGSPVSETTARNYMSACEWAAKCPTVGEMSPGAIYKGAAAPAAVQERIVDRLRNGEMVVADEIDEMIYAYELADPNKSKKRKGSGVLDAQAVLVSSERKVGNQNKEAEEIAAIEIIARLSAWLDYSGIQAFVNLVEQTSYSTLCQVLEARRD